MVYTIYLWWWLVDGLWHCFTHIISIARHHFDQHESSESCKPLRPKNTTVPASTSTVTVDPPAYNWPSLSVSDQRAQFEHRRLGNLEMAWVRMRHLSKICNMRTQPQPTIFVFSTRMRVCSNQSTNNMGLRQKLDFQQLRIQSSRTIRLGTHLNGLEMMPIKTSSFILGFPVSHVWLPEGPLRVSTTKCGHMNMKTSIECVTACPLEERSTWWQHLATVEKLTVTSMDHLTWSSSVSFFFQNAASQQRLLNPLWGKSSPILSWLHPELCLNPISGEWNPKFGWIPNVLLAKITWNPQKSEPWGHRQRHLDWRGSPG